MPFQYQPFDSGPWVQTIGQLMRAGPDAQARALEIAGQAQANAALQSGNAWAGAIQNVGQAIAQVPGQILAARRADQEQQIRALQLGQMQRQVAGQKALAGLMQGDTLPAAYRDPMTGGTLDAVGPRPQSFVGSDGLYDVPKLTAALGSRGFGDQAADLVKGAESINDSILKTQDLRQKMATQQTILYGDLAHGAQLLVQRGVPLEQALDTVAEPALLSKQLDPAQYAQTKARLLGVSADQADQILTGLKDQAGRLAPTKTLGEGVNEVDRYGRTIASGGEKDKPDYTIGDQRFSGKTNQPLGPPVTPPVVAGSESDAVQRARALAVQQNGGVALTDAQIQAVDDKARQEYAQSRTAPPPAQTHTMRLAGVGDVPVDYIPNRDGTGGKWMYQGRDVSGQVRAIPPASVTVQNLAAGLADKIPAWARDASRPTGPDANTIDPTIQRTPNGLYQDAVTYIQTGQYPQVGRGNDPRAQAVRAAVDAKAGAIAADAGMDIPELRSVFRANAGSLNQQQKAFDQASKNIATADRNVALLEPLLAKIGDTGSPKFNATLRDFQKRWFGDPVMGPIGTYLASVQNEYGQLITSGTGNVALTDGARHEAQALIDPNATVAQMLGSIQALKNEGNNRLLSTADQIKAIQGRMRLPGSSSGTTGTTPKGDPMGLF